MAQRYIDINEEINITLKLKVNLTKLSDYKHFGEEQKQNAIDEFKTNIGLHLKNKLIDNVSQDDFLQSIDFVNYEVK